MATLESQITKIYEQVMNPSKVRLVMGDKTRIEDVDDDSNDIIIYVKYFDIKGKDE